MLLNDYPPDIRRRFGRMSRSNRRQANRASLPFFDYAFHARKFLRGIPLTLVLSAVIALMAWAVQAL